MYQKSRRLSKINDANLVPSTHGSSGLISTHNNNSFFIHFSTKYDLLLFSFHFQNLTGGPNGGVHCTDVTNASRTMLMNIATLNWDPLLLKFFQIPSDILPEIRSSSEIYGPINDGLLRGVPISGVS